jgi:hypothetical protein
VEKPLKKSAPRCRDFRGGISDEILLGECGIGKRNKPEAKSSNYVNENKNSKELEI